MFRECERIKAEYVKVDTYETKMDVRASVCLVENQRMDCGVPVLADIGGHTLRTAFP